MLAVLTGPSAIWQTLFWGAALLMFALAAFKVMVKRTNVELVALGLAIVAGLYFWIALAAAWGT